MRTIKCTPFRQSTGLGEIQSGVHRAHRSGGSFVFLDVGANLGSCAVLAGLLGARVFAFEPNPRNLPLVAENIRANNLTARVRLFSCGLADNHTWAAFSTHDTGSRDGKVGTPNSGMGTFAGDRSWAAPDPLKLKLRLAPPSPATRVIWTLLEAGDVCQTVLPPK